MDVTSRRRRSRRRALTAAVGAVAALAVVAAVALPGAAQAIGLSPANDHCNRVEFLGARGSGEATGGPFQGFGPESYKVVTTVAAKLRAEDITYGLDASTYPADSADELAPSLLEILGFPESLPSYYQDHVLPYLASISQGVSFMVANVQDREAACGDAESLVLVGYSQGAIVVHQAEDYLEVHDPAALGHIVGTVLIADGDRMPNTTSKTFGSSGASAEGLQVYLGHFSSHLDMPLPATTAEVCNANDLLCNFGIPQLLDFSASAKVHTTSYANCSGTDCSYGAALVAASNWAAGVVLARV